MEGAVIIVSSLFGAFSNVRIPLLLYVELHGVMRMMGLDNRIIGKFMSTVNAFVCSMSALSVWLRCPEVVTTYGFYECSESVYETIHNGNCVFFAYLFIDVTYGLLTKRKDLTTSAIIHHAVGAASMLMFIIYQDLHFNSIYYQLTEITTIFLNLGWVAIHYHKPGLLKIATGFLLLSFLLIRVVGSAFQFYIIIENREDIFLRFSGLPSLFVVYGNLTLAALNVYWFVKLLWTVHEHFHKGNHVKVD